MSQNGKEMKSIQSRPCTYIETCPFVLSWLFVAFILLAYKKETEEICCFRVSFFRSFLVFSSFCATQQHSLVRHHPSSSAFFLFVFFFYYQIMPKRMLKGEIELTLRRVEFIFIIRHKSIMSSEFCTGNNYTKLKELILMLFQLYCCYLLFILFYIYLFDFL